MVLAASVSSRIVHVSDLRPSIHCSFSPSRGTIEDILVEMVMGSKCIAKTIRADARSSVLVSRTAWLLHLFVSNPAPELPIY